MKILIIGGTKFLGRYIAEEALGRGHSVTLFNRGQTNPGLFPSVEEIHGDRAKDIRLLGDREWDAVVDTCGYVPRIVSEAARLLATRVNTYVFISSGSVYRDFSKKKIAESSLLAELSDPNSEDPSSSDYGALKALCEQTVQKELGSDKTVVVRSGLIVGPHDPTDRLTYWIHRIGTERKLLVPECDRSPFQFIFAGDMAKWILTMIERRKSGIFNATGPKEPLLMLDFLKLCRESLKSHCEFVAVDEKFLLERGLPDWASLPLWIPSTDKQMAGFFDMDCTGAIDAGLQFTKASEVITNTFEWSLSRAKDYTLKVGFDRDREAELLTEWLN